MPILKGSENEGFERVHIPAGTYKATVKAIREGEINDFQNPGEKKTVLFWEFEIKGKTKTVVIDGMTSLAFSGDKAKARKWTKAILGDEPPYEFDTDDLIDRACRVVVIDKTKDEQTFSKVDNVISANEVEL